MLLPSERERAEMVAVAFTHLLLQGVGLLLVRRLALLLRSTLSRLLLQVFNLPDAEEHNAVSMCVRVCVYDDHGLDHSEPMSPYFCWYSLMSLLALLYFLSRVWY